MHNITKLGVVASAATLLGACGSDAKSSTPTTKVATPTTAAAPTITTKSATAAPTTTTKSATPTTAVAAKSGAVDLATMTIGKVLVESEGRTLYAYTKDSQNKPSTCDAACAMTWPPALASGTPAARTGLDSGKLSEIKRSDGTEQLAYNGWPLYRYAKDTKVGEDAGQGVEGVWYVIGATGNPLK